MEAAAPLQHIPGEHNGNAILRLVKQEPHMISLKAGDALVGLSVTLPGLLSPPAGNEDGGDSPRHIPAPVRTELPPPSRLPVPRWTRWQEEGDALQPTPGAKIPPGPPPAPPKRRPTEAHAAAAPPSIPPPAPLENS